MPLHHEELYRKFREIQGRKEKFRKKREKFGQLGLILRENWGINYFLLISPI
jgi:hypothetical protein